MSFKKIESGTTFPNSEYVVKIDNGDYQLLRDTTERLGFRDELSLLRFAVAVLGKARTRSVTVTDVDGERVFRPSEHLLLKDAEPVSEANTPNA